MVRIRLQRGGATKRPFYRLIAIDERRKRDGRALEFLGTYDPKSKPETIDIRIDRVNAWVDRGAQLSATARSLLRKAKARAATQPASPAGSV
ncbi:MAG: 30S ribosomal protein S16 [Deltaproteobacteria bacterium]|nr:MAG: 30S ribosomal protein S16 [Deltaproteobacteria bacterium]